MSLTNLFTDIANAIRTKKGTTDPIPAQNFASEIESIKTEGSSSGGGSTGGETSTSGYKVRVIDYDGTILEEQSLASGETFTLPTPPTHDRLVFQEWTCSYEIVDNQITIGDSNIDIGAIYTTKSGLSEFDIELTLGTGLSVTLNINGTKNWGDGTSDTATTHTYVNYGKYTITSDGNTLSSNSSKSIFGTNQNHFCYGAYLANVTSLPSGTFYNCYLLKNVSIPSSVNNFQGSIFRTCYNLKGVSIPNGVKSIPGRCFLYCRQLKNIVIPHTITSIGSYAFHQCYSLEDIVIPNSVTSIAEYIFYECHNLKNVSMSKNIKTIPNSAFRTCYRLSNLKIPNSVESIGNEVFFECRNLETIEIPNSVTTIGYSAFSNCISIKNISISNNVTDLPANFFDCCFSLQNLELKEGIKTIGTASFAKCYNLDNIKFPSTIASIGDQAFYTDYAIESYDFSRATSIPTLAGTGAINVISRICKIYVPDSLYDEWIVATNWTTFANYIYKASEMED